MSERKQVIGLLEMGGSGWEEAGEEILKGVPLMSCGRQGIFLIVVIVLQLYVHVNTHQIVNTCSLLLISHTSVTLKINHVIIYVYFSFWTVFFSTNLFSCYCFYTVLINMGLQLVLRISSVVFWFPAIPSKYQNQQLDVMTCAR